MLQLIFEPLWLGGVVLPLAVVVDFLSVCFRQRSVDQLMNGFRAQFLQLQRRRFILVSTENQQKCLLVITTGISFDVLLQRFAVDLGKKK